MIPASVVVGSTDEASSVAGALGVAALVVGLVALAVLLPSCHTEEVCTTIAFGVDSCRLDRVCQ